MSGELPDILSALATLEAAITGVKRVYVEPPEDVPPANVPCVIHELSSGKLEPMTSGKSKWDYSHTLPVLILVSSLTKGVGRAKGDAEALVDDYLDMLIDNDSLSGQVKAVTGADYEVQAVEWAGQQYMAIHVNVTVQVVKGASA